MKENKTGNFIAKLRKEKELKQKDLAKILKVSDKTISRWETGLGYPDVSLLVPLSDALDVTVNEILEGREDNNTFTKEEVNNLMKKTISMSELKREKEKAFILGIMLTIYTILLIITLIIFGGKNLEVKSYALIAFPSLIYMIFTSLPNLRKYINLTNWVYFIYLIGYLTIFTYITYFDYYAFTQIYIILFLLLFTVYMILLIFGNKKDCYNIKRIFILLLILLTTFTWYNIYTKLISLGLSESELFSFDGGNLTWLFLNNIIFFPLLLKIASNFSIKASKK